MARKTYRLSPEVEEEIRRLLRPETDRRPVRVTLVFGHPLPSDEETPNAAWEVPAILQDRIVRSVTTSRFRTYWADFDMREVRDLQAAYEAIEAWPRKEVWIEGRPVPYGAGLWLPLLFFYLAEPGSDDG